MGFPIRMFGVSKSTISNLKYNSKTLALSKTAPNLDIPKSTTNDKDRLITISRISYRTYDDQQGMYKLEDLPRESCFPILFHN